MPIMSRNTRYWLFQLGGWGLFALINIFFAFSFDKLNKVDDRIFFFARLGIFVLMGIVITHVMRYVIIGLNFLQRRLERQLLYFILTTLVFAFLVSFLNIELLIRLSDKSILNNVDLLSDNEKKVLRNVGNSYSMNKLLVVLSGAFYFFIYFFIWNLIYFMYHFVTKSQKQQLDTLKPTDY